MTLESLYRITCRPALPQDTVDVLELTKTIWEGHDYIPEVWEDWLRDPVGLLAVAEYGGRVVGLSKLSRLSADEWWLEGLRVHPKYQGQSIAAHLHDYLVDYWSRTTGGVVRLATASFNIKVQHLCDRTGFRKILEVTSFVLHLSQKNSVPSPNQPWVALKADEVQKAIDFTRQSPLFSRSVGLVNLDWRWGRLTDEFLYQAIDEKRAWWWRDQQGLIVQRLDQENGILFPEILLLVCPLDAVGVCLQDFGSFALSQGFERVQWLAPLNLDVQVALHTAGFQREWEDSLFIYEKKKETDE